MSHLALIDDLIKEYLVYRGFTPSLKAFESDLRTCKDKSFCVDKVMDFLMQCVAESSLDRLLSVWNHLEQKVFASLETDQQAAARDLGVALLRRYVTHAASLGAAGTCKVAEFFSKLWPELQSKPEWRDWFALPFIRNPEENSAFAVFFTKHWQETFAVSMHNFLAAVFHYMQLPTLARYQAESELILNLQRENMNLRSRLESINLLGDAGGSDKVSSNLGPAASDIMDDFIVVAQESSNNGGGEYSSSSSAAAAATAAAAAAAAAPSKSLRSLLKSISHASSQMQAVARAADQKRGFGSSESTGSAAAAGAAAGAADNGNGGGTASLPSLQSLSAVEQSSSHHHHQQATLVPGSARGGAGEVAGSAGGTASSDRLPIQLDQETVGRHEAPVHRCLFSPGSDYLATAALDRSLQVHCLAKHSVESLSLSGTVSDCSWHGRHTLVYSTTDSDQIRLYDVINCRHLPAITSATLPSLHNKRITSVNCVLSSHRMVVSFSDFEGVFHAMADGASGEQAQSLLLLYDIRAEKEERVIVLDSGAFAVCVEWRESCPLVAVGCSDGCVRVYDSRHLDRRPAARWTVEADCAVAQVLLQPDADRFYTVTDNNKFACWSMARPGSLIYESWLNDGLLGALRDPLCSAPLATEGVSAGRQFALSRDGSHVLLCGREGGKLHRVAADRLMPTSCDLLGHRRPVVACDMAANTVCATASHDGTVKTSTVMLHD